MESEQNKYIAAHGMSKAGCAQSQYAAESAVGEFVRNYDAVTEASIMQERSSLGHSGPIRNVEMNAEREYAKRHKEAEESHSKLMNARKNLMDFSSKHMAKQVELKSNSDRSKAVLQKHLSEERAPHVTQAFHGALQKEMNHEKHLVSEFHRHRQVHMEAENSHLNEVENAFARYSRVNEK